MLYEKSTVMRQNRRLVSELLARETVPFDMKDFVVSVKTLLKQPSLMSTEQDDSILQYLEFLQQLQKTFRGCSFVVEPKQGWDENSKRVYVSYTYGELGNKLRQVCRDGMGIAPKIYLYVPTYRFTTGWVSFGDFRIQRTDRLSPEPLEVPKIGIWGHNITNETVDNDKYQHSLKTTVRLKTALATAKTWFREEDMAKVALLESDQIRNSANDTDLSIETLVLKARTQLTSHKAFPAYIEQIVDNDLFVGDLQQELQEYVTELKYERENASLNRPRSILYVRGYVEDEHQVFDRVRLMSSGSFLPEVLGTCKEEDLPEEVKRKLSLLMMEEDESFIANVGYKLDGEVYYVYE